MAAETIQEFLVGLGFQVKADEQRTFIDAIGKGKVAALALTATLVGLVATVAKVASSYEALFYQSQRVGASVENIQAFDYAISQVGGSAAGAVASLEGMGSFLRSSPGAESLISRLGVQTRDANGGLRDTATMLTELGAQFRAMPYYRAHAYAGVLGIDEKTLQALIRGTGEFSAQLKNMYQAAGISSTEAARGSAVFMQQLRGLGTALQVLRDKVALSLERGVGGDIERLRKLLVDNFGRISAVIVGVTGFVLELGEGLMQLVGRAADIIGGLIDWFTHLDRGTKIWIETLGGLLLAWRLLNLAFLASPIGIIATLGLGFLALYDDYKVWKEGGKSLIDWAAWKPGIDAFLDALHTIEQAFVTFWPKVKPFLAPLLTYWKTELLSALKTVGGVLGEEALAFDALVHGRLGEYLQHARNIVALLAEGGAAAVKNIGGLVAGENTVSGGALADMGHRAANLATDAYARITGTTSQREAIGADILGRSGLDADHSAAMLGNAQQESGLDPIRRHYNAKGEADHFGLFQWDQIRADQIKSQFGIDIKTADFATQIKAAVLEGTQGQEKRGFGQFLATPGLSASAGAFAEKFERSGEKPGDRGYDARLSNAQHIAGHLAAARRPLIGAQDIHNRVAASGPASVATTTVGGSPRIDSRTTIHVSGAGNPAAVAKSVAQQQDWVTASLVRNMGPLAR